MCRRHPGLFDETSPKEIDMLLHLPIVILATLSPIAVSDTPPKLDTVRECGFEAGSVVDLDRCSRDEAVALGQLQQAWTKFAGADKKTCVGETTLGSFSSYVELLTCLEMARDAASSNTNPENPPARSGLRPKQPDQADVTVGEADRHGGDDSRHTPLMRQRARGAC
jgi:hypothetical protein